MSMKNSNDTGGDRTHDLPTWCAVPQPTAPPRATWKQSNDFIATVMKDEQQWFWAHCDIFVHESAAGEPQAAAILLGSLHS